MNKLTVFLLSAAAACVMYIAADYYFAAQRVADGIEEPAQIYAGEPIPQPSSVQDAKPSLYSCGNENKRLYMVIAMSGEFMLFDQKGMWINNGRFFEAKTDQGVNYWHAEVGSSLLGLFKHADNRWHLAIATEEDVSELICV